MGLVQVIIFKCLDFLLEAYCIPESHGINSGVQIN